MLSSRSVAFAASACLRCPSGHGATAIHPAQRLAPIDEGALAEHPSAGGVRSQTYSWRNALILAPTLGGVRIQGSTSRDTSLQRITAAPRARDRVWVAGDRFQVQVQVTWTCTGRRS